MKKLILLLLLGTAFAQGPSLPPVAGVFTASLYGGWTNHITVGNPTIGASSIQMAQGYATLSDGTVIVPFATNAPLLIDIGVNQETVTPTAVNNCLTVQSNITSCTVTAVFTKLHFNGAPVSSATFGLQEAINVVSLSGGVVVVDSTWRGTTAQITNAAGDTAVAIQDNRSGFPATYTWNGTNYIPSTGFSPGGDVTGTSGALQVIGILGQQLPPLATGFLNWNGTAWNFTTPSGGGGAPAPPAGALQLYNSGTLGAATDTNQTSTVTYTQSTGNLNVPKLNKIRYVTPDFAWSRGSFGALTGGTPATVTITPVPLGVNGTDTNLYVYISGGTGTAEAALVTGGTAVAGASSGTLQFTPANSHSGAFTVGSASSGIYEALRDAQATNNNNVHLVFQPTNPPGSVFYSIFAPVTVSGAHIDLDGGGTTIDCEASRACFVMPTINTGPVHIHGFRVSTKAQYPGATITQTACASNVSTITSTLNPAVGSYVDIQMTRNTHYLGPHVVASTSGSSWTYTDTNCGGLTTIAAQAEDYAGNAPQFAFIEDNGQGNEFNAIALDSPGGFQTKTLNNLFVILDDQKAHIHDVQLNSSLSGCTTAYCANGIYAPGPFATNPAVLDIDNLGFSMFCNGNGITAFNGNTVSVKDSVVQGFNEWSIQAGITRGGFGGTAIDNVYNESASCTNPWYAASGLTSFGAIASTGLIQNGGGVQARNGEGPSGNIPNFANTGSSNYAYYVVIHDTTAGTVSYPYYFGQALSNGSGSILVGWPRYLQPTSLGDTITYDVLRITVTGGSLTSNVPTGTGNFAVATGIAQCSTPVCTTTDTNAALTSYTVAQENNNNLAFFYWPGAALLNTAGSSPAASIFLDSYFPSLQEPFLIPQGYKSISVYANYCGGGLNAEPNTVSCLATNPSVNNNTTLTPTILQNGLFSGDITSGLKGRLQFHANEANGIVRGHLITLVDSNPVRQAASLYRVSADTNDTFIGLDNGNAQPFSNAGLAFGAPISISQYIGNVGDGTNWKERLTSAAETYNIPLVVTSGNSVTLAGISGSTQCLHVNSSGVISGAGFDCGASGVASIFGQTGAVTTLPSPTFTGTANGVNLTLTGTLTTNMTGGPFCVHETGGVLSATGSDCGAGGGGTFQSNGVNLSSSSTINFQNSAAFNGLTATFSNPSAGNVQLGFSGTLGNAGLTNSSTTVNGQTVALGASGNVNPGNTVHGVALNEGNGNQIGGTGAGLTNQIIASAGSSADPTYKSFADLQSTDYVSGGGTAQAQTVTLTPAATALTAGLEVLWKPSNANSGAGPTLAVNGLTATTITKCGTTALAANDLTTAAVAIAVYDGTQFQLLNPQAATCGAGSPVWSSLQNPSGNQSLTMGTNTSTFTYGDFGASPSTGIFTETDSASTSTDLSVNHLFTTGGSSRHTPLAVQIQGINQLQVCWQAGPQGEVVFGSSVTCPNINQSPFAKVVEMSSTAAHTVLRLFQSSTAATGTMQEWNNATAAGTGFKFFTANAGCTNGDTSCGAGAAVATLDGAGNFSGTSFASTGSNGGFGGPEGTGATITTAANCTSSGVDCIWPDSTAHAFVATYGTQAKAPISLTIASGSVALGVGAISSGTCASVVTASGTGILTTDVITASFNGDPTGITGYIPTTNGMLTIIAYPTANNANFKVCNNTASSITPGAVTLNWRVIR